MFGELQEYLGEGVVSRADHAGRERFNREGAMARGNAKRDFFTAENEREQRLGREMLNIVVAGRKALRAKRFLNTET